MNPLRRYVTVLGVFTVGSAGIPTAAFAVEDCRQTASACSSGDMYNAAMDAISLSCAANGVNPATAIYMYGDAWCVNGVIYASGTCM